MESIIIKEETLPMAWERAVLETWEKGARFRTEYDKPGDPESRDTVAFIEVKSPFSEPRIHRAFPGGLEDLEMYRQEVVFGVHDHWVNPKEGKWEYTYHQRLFGYDVTGREPIDQIAAAIEKLKQAPYTRRAQAITWQPWNDIGINDPSCLQRVWFRVENRKLNMNVHMRSNDAFKAAGMNMFAFTDLQEYVAEQLGIETGEYRHIADSFHIYGSYFEEFKNFLDTVQKRKPEDRVWTSEFAQPMFVDGKLRLLHDNFDNPALRIRLTDARRIYSEIPEADRSRVSQEVLDYIK